MPTANKRKKPIAAFVADIHLSLKPPIWRSAEEDWLKAIKYQLNQLREIQKKYVIPIYCAGDVFDHWYGAHQSSELINFAIANLPKMHAIPGQHDLPNHNLEDIKKSAFWTLVEAGKIVPLGLFEDNFEVYFYDEDKRIIINSFPFGKEIKPIKRRKELDAIYIAMAHQYIWIDGHSYPNAPKENKISDTVIDKDKWLGYDIAVFGDNHKGFQITNKNTTFYNCGGFMRRKSDEIKYKPKIGLLYDNATIKEHYLDTSTDKYIPIVDKEIETSIDMSDFIKRLEGLESDTICFASRLREVLNSNKKTLPAPLIQLISEALEHNERD